MSHQRKQQIRNLFPLRIESGIFKIFVNIRMAVSYPFGIYANCKYSSAGNVK